MATRKRGRPKGAKTKDDKRVVRDAERLVKHGSQAFVGLITPEQAISDAARAAAEENKMTEPKSHRRRIERRLGGADIDKKQIAQGLGAVVVDHVRKRRPKRT